jgi:peptidoglycan/LPS O-acetylase OafA/YrhL
MMSSSRREPEPARAPANPKAGRLTELDSVRGLAAFVVLLHHCWQAILPDQNVFPVIIQGTTAVHSSAFLKAAFVVSVTPLRLLFSGHAAVAVFFVLSGFVLTQSAGSTNWAQYPAYLVRRVCRIWLPFAVAILAATSLCLALAPVPIQGMDWVNSSWNLPVDFRLVAGHLLMVGTSFYETLDNPMWSLVHEMRISVIFPLLVLATVASPRITLLVSLLTLVALSITRLFTPLDALAASHLAAGILLSCMQTARYVFCFVLGILLAQRESHITALLRANPVLRSGLWVATAALLCIPYTKSYLDLAYAVGAVSLLALCMSTPSVVRWLRTPALVHLGETSYSLYLFHLIVILALIHILHDRLSIYWILCIAIPSALLMAWFSHRFIEMPANRFGKSMARRLNPST